MCVCVGGGGKGGTQATQVVASNAPAFNTVIQVCVRGGGDESVPLISSAVNIYKWPETTLAVSPPLPHTPDILPHPPPLPHTPDILPHPTPSPRSMWWSRRPSS